VNLGALLENPKGINFESQEKDEELFYILRRHPITNLGWILLTLFLILFPVISLPLVSNLREFLLVYIPDKYELISIVIWYNFTLFITFESFLMWYFNVYIITNKRVIDVDFHGLWRKRVSETSLDNIQDATYETHNFFHILFNYGNISIQTAAEKREFEFVGIPHPDKVHDKLTNLVVEYKQKHGNN
jgi:uncharacterized membrane protein YdbT with pleckstrin-like domain